LGYVNKNHKKIIEVQCEVLNFVILYKSDKHLFSKGVKEWFFVGIMDKFYKSWC
jgi:hypothetical protein